MTIGMAEYRLVSTWQIEAPLQNVYDAISRPAQWRDWWPGLNQVGRRDPGSTDDVGKMLRYPWGNGLSHGIFFYARTTRAEPLVALEVNVVGDLEGSGRWLFRHEKGVTTVLHEWHVRTTGWRMALLSALARPTFERNHRMLMQNGAEGLARLLDARLVGVSHRMLPAPARSGGSAPQRHAFDVAAAVTAGIGAGIIATVVQILLWWVFSFPLPGILLRDSRFAAAIVMGPAVLPPPATFEWNVMLIATLVHFALSIGYGVLLAALLMRLGQKRILLTGAVFGLLLYAVNMYGFTAIFPWFESSRDWITATAHVAFGIAAAAIWKSWRIAGMRDSDDGRSQQDATEV
jgi:hypothetical protein